MDGGDGGVCGGGGRRGSCCMAHPDDISKADRIMLKFRPIAPKPPVGCPVIETKTNTVLGVLGSGRKRRRYRKNISDSYVADKNKTRSEPEPEPKPTSPNSELGLTPATKPLTLPRVITPVPEMNKVSSIVTVENLTDTCVVEEYGLGYSDGERMHRLNVDTCPGFVSDWFGRVIWTNGAYKELVGGGGGGGGGGEWVSLVMKEGDQRILMILGAVFTCRVRLQYYGCRSMTIPCDAWRMDCGGFAWRLDIKAALSL